MANLGRDTENGIILKRYLLCTVDNNYIDAVIEICQSIATEMSSDKQRGEIYRSQVFMCMYILHHLEAFHKNIQTLLKDLEKIKFVNSKLVISLSRYTFTN